jgi:hypothetical protein
MPYHFFFLISSSLGRKCRWLFARLHRVNPRRWYSSDIVGVFDTNETLCTLSRITMFTERRELYDI